MEHVRNHLPEMVEVMKERIAVPEEGKCCYQVPGTIHEVELSLRTYEEEWSVWVSVRNVNSNVSAIGGTDEKSLEELRAYLKTPEVLEELFREYTRVLQGLKTRN